MKQKERPGRSAAKSARYAANTTREYSKNRAKGVGDTPYTKMDLVADVLGAGAGSARQKATQKRFSLDLARHSTSLLKKREKMGSKGKKK